MNNTSLLEQLSYKKAYRENRMQAALWVIENPQTFEKLLNYCFTSKTELAYKAAWVLEFVYLENPKWLLPHLDLFFKHLPSINLDQTLRPLAHICELIAISNYKKKDIDVIAVFLEKHKKTLIDCSFDWLITEQKVACQVRAMTALYYLGTEFEWIHPELKQIIEQNIHLGSAGYQSRGKKTIKQIDTFQNNKTKN